jgi:cell division transport system permease protein
MENVKRKKKLGGYPAIGVVTSITLILFALGLFGNLLIYSGQYGKVVRDNLNMVVFLKSSVTKSQRAQLEKTLSSKAFVAETDNPIEFKSKEEAFKDLESEIGDSKAIISENPLKDAFMIKIKASLQDSTNVKKIKDEIEGMNGVFEVDYDPHLFAVVNENVFNISMVLVVITVTMIIVTLLLVNNTLKLALFSQRFLIRSMQLVGAKSWFIQWPFLLRASGYGLLAGIIASVALWRLSAYLLQRIPDVNLIHNQKQFGMLLGIMIATGVIIAVFSTFFSIRKYLRMSLDQLY